MMTEWQDINQLHQRTFTACVGEPLVDGDESTKHNISCLSRSLLHRSALRSCHRKVLL